MGDTKMNAMASSRVNLLGQRHRQNETEWSNFYNRGTARDFWEAEADE